MTRNKIIYLVLVVYCVIFAILYNEYIAALILIVILLLPVVLLSLLYGTIPFVKVTLDFSDKLIIRGDEITLSFQVENTSILPITNCKLWISCWDQSTKQQENQEIFISMDAKSEQIVRCSMKANDCGIITFSLGAVEIYDYLRIFSFRKPVKKTVKFTVLPKIYEIEEEFTPNPFGVSLESDVFSTKKPGDDPSEVFDIREYKEGDRIHRIHWKLSSKKDQYMIKDFSFPINCSVDILLDLHCEADKKKTRGFLNVVYETMFSLSNHLIMAGITHSITWYDIERKHCRRVQIEEWDQVYSVVDELYHNEGYTQKGAFIRAYHAEYEREQIADLFLVSENYTHETQAYIKLSQESRLHVLCLGSQMEQEDKADVKISIIEMDNIEASLKRVVF